LNLITTDGGTVKANGVALVDQNALDALIARVAELEARLADAGIPERKAAGWLKAPGWNQN
jgi:hypothetical protein